MARYRKLIETSQESLVVCDNLECDFKVPGSLNLSIKRFLNVGCPKCGENLLTQEDYDQWVALHTYVRFINKWFSWISVFLKESKEPHSTSVHVHNGVKFTNETK